MRPGTGGRRGREQVAQDLLGVWGDVADADDAPVGVAGRHVSSELYLLEDFFEASSRVVPDPLAEGCDRYEPGGDVEAERFGLGFAGTKAQHGDAYAAGMRLQCGEERSGHPCPAMPRCDIHDVEFGDVIVQRAKYDAAHRITVVRGNPEAANWSCERRRVEGVRGGEAVSALYLVPERVAQRSGCRRGGIAAQNNDLAGHRCHCSVAVCVIGKDAEVVVEVLAASQITCALPSRIARVTQIMLGRPPMGQRHRTRVERIEADHR